MTTELVNAATEQQQRPSRRRATIEEFWALPESNLPCEYIDGEIIMAPTPSFSHQRVVFHIARMLQAYVEKTQTGEVCVSPLDVVLPTGEVVQPDVFFLLPEEVARAKADNRLRGVVPALAVEVLSPGSVRHDTVTKRHLYQKNGVREYWIVDAETKTLAQLVLAGEHYELEDLTEKDILRSAVLEGFEMNVGALLRLD